MRFYIKRLVETDALLLNTRPRWKMLATYDDYGDFYIEADGHFYTLYKGHMFELLTDNFDMAQKIRNTILDRIFVERAIYSDNEVVIKAPIFLRCEGFLKIHEFKYCCDRYNLYTNGHFYYGQMYIESNDLIMLCKSELTHDKAIALYKNYLTNERGFEL